MTVNRRAHGSRSRRSGRPASARPEPDPGGEDAQREESGGRTDGHAPAAGRRSQSERRRQTRQALLDAALDQLDAGIGFDQLSLRRVARAAGVVPAAFYRHFDSMDELGLTLVEESVRALRGMLREAREGGASPERVITRSVSILVAHVREHRRHFVFLADARSSANTVVRHTIRNEIRLFASELATDLARFPELHDWSTVDLQMLAGLFVDTMIGAIDALLESPANALALDDGPSEIAALTEKRLRLIALGVPQWRSRP